MTDPTLRADLIAFLAAKGRVRLSTPDYGVRCSMPRCDNDRDSSSRYCAECRYAEKYRENQQNTHFSDVVFHDDIKQILRAYRFLRRLANRRLEAA